MGGMPFAGIPPEGEMRGLPASRRALGAFSRQDALPA